eukprot:366472-Chlamydomonas_euryale.AAC.2
MISCFVHGLKLVRTCASSTSPASSITTTSGASLFCSSDLYFAAAVVVQPMMRALLSTCSLLWSFSPRNSACQAWTRSKRSASFAAHLHRDSHASDQRCIMTLPLHSFSSATLIFPGWKALHAAALLGESIAEIIWNPGQGMDMISIYLDSGGMTADVRLVTDILDVVHES